MKQPIKYTILTVFCLTLFITSNEAAAQNYSTEGYTAVSGNTAITGTDVNNKFIVKDNTSWNSSVTFNGNGTLYLIVEGTATISWMSINNFEVIVGTTGSLTNFDNMSYGITKLTNYSNSFELSSVSKTLINYGTVKGKPDIAIYNGATLENYGTVNTTNLTTDYVVKNSGLMNISGSLAIYSNATLENSCKIRVAGEFTNDNDLIMKENSYMEVLVNTSFYNNSSITLKADAFLKTKNLTTWGNEVAGPASGHALIQYFGTLIGNMPAFSSYNIYFVDSEGNVNGTPVSYSIAATNCNPGFGVVPDADHDGIPDSQDEFPNDATRAFISYYPSDEGTWNTLMFEDKWPELGDYDFNDLVIKYQYEFYSNADNEVVDLVAHFQVVAAGASYANGFGFKLDIPNSSVLDVSGDVHSGTSIVLNANKTEQGASDEAVIIVYDNINTLLGGTFINVRRDGTTKEIDPISIHVQLDKINRDLLNTIDPFLYVNQIRGREVHLMGYSPTSKANNSYFGTANDDSDSGTYYRSTQGYPWCLDVPADVRHMLETIDFTIGYPDFVKWANSGGTQYTDWYRTNLYTPALY